LIARWMTVTGSSVRQRPGLSASLSALNSFWIASVVVALPVLPICPLWARLAPI
jgi:hypothetical protein